MAKAAICFIAAFKNTAVATAWVWMRETPGLATLVAVGLCLAGVTITPSSVHV